MENCDKMTSFTVIPENYKQPNIVVGKPNKELVVKKKPSKMRRRSRIITAR